MKRLTTLLAAVVLVALSVGASAQDRGTIDQVGQIYGRLSSLLGVAVQGDYAYIADRHNGLRIYDISDPSHPSLTGFWDETDGWANAVCVAGQYAYLLEGKSLYILDISNPAAPAQVGVCANDGFGWMVTSALRGNYLYIGDESRGLWIIDVADPAHPAQVGFYEIDNHGGEAEMGIPSLIPYGENILIASMLIQGIGVFDVSDPTNPTLLNEHHFNAQVTKFEVSGDYIFAACSGDGLLVLHILEGNDVEEVARLDVEGWGGGIAFDGTIAYLAYGMSNEDIRTGRLDVIDVADPGQPEMIGRVELPHWANDLSIADGHLLIATDDGALLTVDVSDPVTPVNDGMIDEHGLIQDVSLSGNLLCVADYYQGLLLVNVSDPAHPVEVYQYAETRLNGVSSDDWYAYLTSGGARFTIISLSEEVENRLVGSVATHSEAMDVVVEDEYAYVALDWGGVEIFDIHDPTNPTSIALYETENPVYAVAVENDLAYLATEGLVILDVSDPASPVFCSELSIGQVQDIVVDGSEAYVISPNEFTAMSIVDVSDPFAPRLLGGVEVGRSLIGISLDGGYAYVADGVYGIHAIDVRNPDYPVEAAACNTPSYASALTARNGMIYVADWFSVGIYHFSPANSVKDPKEAGSNGKMGLLSAYPNPFNGVTQISWTAPAASRAVISAYDVSGAKVGEIYNGMSAVGRGETSFNAGALPTGTYFIRLDVAGKTMTRSLRLVK